MNRSLSFCLSCDFIFSFPPKLPARRWIFLFLSIGFYSSPIFSQIDINRTVFTTEDGLAGNQTSCGLMDSKGYMWIGTSNGLSRYDVHGFKNFRHDPEDPTSICGNSIRDIYEDENGFLWIATEGGGLAKYDQKKEEFSCIMPAPGDSTSISGNKVQKIFKDKDGDVWIGMLDEGFNFFHQKEGTFTRFSLVDKELTRRRKFDRNTVFDIIQDISDPNVLWIAAHQIFMFNKKTYELKQIKGSPFKKHALFMDAAGELWVGIWRDGLAKYIVIEDKWEYFYPKPWGAEGRSLTGSTNIVLDIKRKSHDELWLATNPHGLSVFNTKTKTFTFTADQTIISDEQIVEKLLIDRQGRLWAFSWGGVQVFDSNKPVIPHYHVTKKQAGLSQTYHVVNALDVDVKGNYWLGTDYGDGIYTFDKKTESSEPISIAFPPQHGNKEGYQISSILVGSDESIWATDYKRGWLLKLNEETNSFQRFQPEFFEALFRKRRFLATQLLEDNLGNIWMGTAHGGIIRYDIKTDSLQQFVSYEKDTLNMDTRSQVYAMEMDSKGNIWIGTDAYGLYVFNIEKEAFVKRFQQLPDGKGGLLHDKVDCLEEDPYGNIWVGYKTHGIQIINPSFPPTQNQRYLSTKHGLPSNRIFGIEKDHNGNLWILTESELCKYDFTTASFTTFGKREGIDNILTWSIPMRSLKTGEIFIGRKDGGFYLFHPDSIPVNTVQPDIVFTEIKVLNETRSFAKAIDYLDDITLKYSENFFTLQFAALNFTRPDKNQYKYMLEGFDPDTIYSGNRHFASYTNVPEGEYIFWVTGSNNDGVWSETGRRIKITILPPWYRTGWAYLVYFILMTAGIYAYYRFQKRRWLLKTELQLEHGEKERLMELDRVKSRLYTNITHEFRTPLTVIKGMAEQVAGNDQKKELILRNSDTLINMVNQMLDLSKLEAGALQVHWVQGDVVYYLKFIVESWHSVADAKKLNLAFYSKKERLMMDFDLEKLQQVVNNLLSNGVKFTPEYGGVVVAADFDDRFFEIEVKDTGNGIPADRLKHIFDRFYQVDDSSTRKAGGTGIGLALAKELVQLMGGTISVKSALEKGTSFYVKLPIHNSAPVENTVSQYFKKAPHEAESAKAKKPSPIFDQENLPLILVVEDNADVIEYIISCLEKEYRVISARNGKIGYNMVHEHTPDLVLCDVMMPEMDGFELSEKIKSDELTDHIPVVLLTAKATQQDRLEGLAVGVDAYLTKPFNKEELRLCLRNLLNIKRRIQAYLTHGENGLGNTSPLDAKAKAFLDQAHKIVLKNLDNENFGVPHLSKGMGFSKSTLHREFKSLSDLTPSFFILSVRLTEARKLLETTHLTVNEVSYQVGFKYPNHFSTAYKSFFGFSPSETAK